MKCTQRLAKSTGLWLILCCFSYLAVAQSPFTVNGTGQTQEAGAPGCSGSSGTNEFDNIYGSYGGNVGGGCWQFTEQGGTFQSDAVWMCDCIDLDNGFQVCMTMNLGSQDALGGDGIAFVLQNEGTTVRGGQGGGMGFMDGDLTNCVPSSPSTNCEISPSVAVEFDTFDNGTNDPTCDHVQLSYGGDDNNALSGPTCMDGGAGANFEDGANHDVCITWNPAAPSYTVTIDGVTVVSYNGDIRTRLTNPDCVYWGFTAASGGGVGQTQNVCNVTFTPSTLGVDLLNFNAISAEDKITVYWSTATEEDNEKFEIQRSADGRVYETIGEVQAKNKVEGARYVFVDENPLSGTNFYRLKQHDYSGEATQYNAAVAYLKDASALNVTVFQNTVYLDGVETPSMVAVYSLNGQLMQQFQVNENSTSFTLPRGMFVLQIHSAKGATVRKITTLYEE